MSYSDYDPAALAEALVEAERSGMDTLLSDKSDKYTSLVSGYSSLETLLDEVGRARDVAQQVARSGA
jgi:hypothetical protein